MDDTAYRSHYIKPHCGVYVHITIPHFDRVVDLYGPRIYCGINSILIPDVLERCEVRIDGKALTVASIPIIISNIDFLIEYKFIIKNRTFVVPVSSAAHGIVKNSRDSQITLAVSNLKILYLRYHILRFGAHASNLERYLAEYDIACILVNTEELLLFDFFLCVSAELNCIDDAVNIAINFIYPCLCNKN